MLVLNTYLPPYIDSFRIPMLNFNALTYFGYPFSQIISITWIFRLYIIYLNDHPEKYSATASFIKRSVIQQILTDVNSKRLERSKVTFLLSVHWMPIFLPVYLLKSCIETFFQPVGSHPNQISECTGFCIRTSNKSWQMQVWWWTVTATQILGNCRYQ